MRYVWLELKEEEVKRREERKTNTLLGNNIYGEKELFLSLLNTFKVETAADNRKYAKLADTIEKFEDPNWLMVQDDDWQWIKKHIEKINFAVTFRDQQGNEQPFFPAPFRRAIAKLHEKIELASDVMPSDYAEQVKKEEVKKANAKVKAVSN